MLLKTLDSTDLIAFHLHWIESTVHFSVKIPTLKICAISAQNESELWLFTFNNLATSTKNQKCICHFSNFEFMNMNNKRNKIFKKIEFLLPNYHNKIDGPWRINSYTSKIDVVMRWMSVFTFWTTGSRNFKLETVKDFIIKQNQCFCQKWWLIMLRNHDCIKKQLIWTSSQIIEQSAFPSNRKCLNFTTSQSLI